MKTASSQVAWALLTEGVTAARLEAHRLGHLLNRALKLIDASERKEHLHQVAGDLIQAFPKRLEHLNGHLDRTSYALTRMGQDFLESRLPLGDKALVEESVHSALGTTHLSEAEMRIVRRVAALYMARDSDE